MHDYLVEFFNHIKELFLYIPRTIWGQFVDAIIEVMQAIFTACTGCDPSTAAANIESVILNMGPALLWFLSWFKLDMGLRVIGCALLIRFLIRRLPVIG